MELRLLLHSEQERVSGNFGLDRCEALATGQDRISCERYKQLRLEGAWKSALSSPDLKGFLDLAERSPSQWYRDVFSVENVNVESMVVQSTLSTQVANTKPKEQMWSMCTMCSYQEGRVTLYDPDNVLTHMHGKTPTLAQSRYHGYFQPRSDRIEGTITRHALDVSECAYLITTPTFIVPVLNLHFGHVLIDLIEPLFHTMMSHYGRVVGDSLIFLESGAHEDQAMMSTMIDLLFHPSRDKPQGMLRFLTFNAVHSKHALDLLSSSSSSKVCFERLHLGVEADISHLHLGYARHPRFLTSYPLSFKTLANMNVEAYIKEGLGKPNPNPDPNSNCNSKLETRTLTLTLTLLNLNPNPNPNPNRKPSPQPPQP
jgi:hypothetical protein